jgi:uncharacterized membrane protein YedE/YeeE
MSTSNQTTAIEAKTRKDNLLVQVLLGLLFGIILVKSEVVSWFRIQEMFRLQSFHMYGTIGGAVVVAALSIWIIRRFNIRSVYGDAVAIKPKARTRGADVLFGGAIFGLGWALLGACPGPIYALIGSGLTVMIAALVAAIAGAWVYGALKPRLPH